MVLKNQYLTLTAAPGIHPMAVLTYEQPERATHHTANRQAQKDQHLTDLHHREVQGVQVPLETVTPLQVHEMALSILHHEEAALLQPEALNQEAAVAKAPTDPDLRNHQHIHHPNHQVGQAQKAAILLRRREVREAAIQHPALRRVHQVTAVAALREAAADQLGDQDRQFIII